MALLSAVNYLDECKTTLESGDAREALKRLREALASLSEDAPIAWTGSGHKMVGGKVVAKDYRSKVGDFLKKKTRDTLGINGQARKDARGAYKQGQDALAHSKQVNKDAEHFAQKGDVNRAVGAHNTAVKTHQAAMQTFKRTMDRADKEGDRETSDWAAKAGAYHTAVRTNHMAQGSAIRKWAVGQKKAVAANNAQASAAHTAAQAQATKPQGNSFGAMAQAHLKKVAATHQARATQAAGATPFSSSPSSAPPVHAPAPAASPAAASTPIGKGKRKVPSAAGARVRRKKVAGGMPSP